MAWKKSETLLLQEKAGAACWELLGDRGINLNKATVWQINHNKE